MSEHACALEHEVRRELAREVLAHVNADIVYAVQRHQNGTKLYRDTEQELALVGQAIRLDAATTIRWLVQDTRPEPPLTLDRFEAHLLQANQIGQYSTERHLFEQFLTDLATAHAARALVVIQ